MTPHPPTSSDPFEMDDAAYLLGALSPTERAQYEQHLQTCDACSRSLTELAGLPGVLRRLPVEVVQSMDEREAEDPAGWSTAPPSILADVLERAEAEERRRRRVTGLRWASALTTAAAAVVVAVLAFVGPGLGTDPRGPTPAATPGPTAQAQPTTRLDLERVADTSVSAVVSLRDVAWGTKIQIEADYPQAGSADPYASAPQYSLVVNAADGRSEQVATWNAVAGRELTIDAATAVRGADIVSLEIRAQDGTPVLRTAT